MPLFVGSGTTSGGGFEAQSSQAGIPTSTSDPQNANVGDVYVQRVGAGATMKLYDGSSWNQVGGAQNVVPTISGGDPYAPPTGIYEIRVFTSPGTLTVTRDVDAEAIIIAGGGGGGHHGTNTGGGGGAGGVISTSFTLSSGSYPIGVGTGGFSNFPGIPGAVQGFPGGNSTFNGFTACGGGGGGGGTQNLPSRNGLPGGSGGGAGKGFGPTVPGGTAGSGVCGQGFPGGPANPTISGGGGSYLSAPAGLNAIKAGGGGGLRWQLPTTVCGTDAYGITRFAGGGGGCGSPADGYYGLGGPGGPPSAPGTDGAVFIRFKKCQ